MEGGTITLSGLKAPQTRRIICIAAFLSMLASCGIDRRAPGDFCKEQNRQIPRSERIESVLIDILGERERYDREFGRKGVHYFAWRDDYIAEHPDATDRQIARTYSKRFPDCCEVTPPSYLDSEIISQDNWEVIYENTTLSDWAADVYVWVKLPPHHSPKFNERIGRIASVCNDKIQYTGYLHAVLE